MSVQSSHINRFSSQTTHKFENEYKDRHGNGIHDFWLYSCSTGVCMHINGIFEHSSNGRVHTTETVECCFGLYHCCCSYVILFRGKVNILGKYPMCSTQDILKCKMFCIILHCLYVILNEMSGKCITCSAQHIPKWEMQNSLLKTTCDDLIHYLCLTYHHPLTIQYSPDLDKTNRHGIKL